MTWHHSYVTVDGVMVHPFDAEALEYFNRLYSQFLMELSNMHLGLCTDEFNSFRLFTAFYSC